MKTKAARVDGGANGATIMQWIALLAIGAILGLLFVHAFDRESAIADTVRTQRADRADTISILTDGTELHHFTVTAKKGSR